MEPWEARGTADREAARRTTLIRAEHVWLLLPVGGFRNEWVPAVLHEWRQAGNDWVGFVSYGHRYWSETPNDPGHWSGLASQMWAKADRIRSMCPSPRAPDQ